MKRIFLLLGFVFCTAALSAQSGQDKFVIEMAQAYGYVHQIYDFSMINELVDYYNNRSYFLPEERMGFFTNLSGVVYEQSLGMEGKPWWIVLSLSRATQERQSLYNVDGKQYRRALRLMNFSGGIRGGLRFKLSKKSQLRLGADLQLGKWAFQGRTYGVADGRPKWDKISDQLISQTGLTLSLELGKPVGIILQSYYLYGTTRINTWSLRRHLDPIPSFIILPVDAVLFRPSHYGFRILINFYEEEQGSLLDKGKNWKL